MNAPEEINLREWRNPDNCTLPICYFSKRDTRWIVPRRNNAMGWTFNLGHSRGGVGVAAELSHSCRAVDGSTVAGAVDRIADPFNQAFEYKP